MSRPTRYPKRIDKLQRALMGQREMLDMTYDELAAAAGISKATAHRLMHQPEKMSLMQLYAFCHALQLRGDDIRDLIPLP